jgi:hypothetical protein
MQTITTNGTTASGAGARMAAAQSAALVRVVNSATNRIMPAWERVRHGGADDTESPNNSSPRISTNLVSLNKTGVLLLPTDGPRKAGRRTGSTREMSPREARQPAG